jgi:hypothetical protein
VRSQGTSAEGNHRLVWFTVVGAVFMTLAGSTMHFVYDWSGHNAAVGLFGPVNESIWEHAKLVFWPPLLWYTFTAASLRHDPPHEFLGASAVSLWFMPLFQIAFYYLYAAIAGGDLFVMDLVDFQLTVILGQLLFYGLAVRMHCTKAGRIAAILSVVSLVAVFFLFTFQPPHVPVFRDPRNGTFGIPW